MAPGPDGFCFAHSPERKQERDEARSLGGLRRSGQIALAVLADNEALPDKEHTPADIMHLLAETIRHTQTGRLDYRLGATVGNLASLLLRAMYVRKEFESDFMPWWKDCRPPRQRPCSPS